MTNHGAKIGAIMLAKLMWDRVQARGRHEVTDAMMADYGEFTTYLPGALSALGLALDRLPGRYIVRQSNDAPMATYPEETTT